VVTPSRVDNCPNTCLEAQALGKIVIGTRQSSLEELVDHGVTGFLAEPGSA
jgi:glycosyltransferase involved in cell wall biosynthesis